MLKQIFFGMSMVAIIALSAVDAYGQFGKVSIKISADTVEINPSLPPFIIQITTGFAPKPGDEPEGVRLQISFFGGPQNKQVVEDSTARLWAEDISFADINFDGFKDILVYARRGYNGVSTYSYLFDPSDSAFKLSDEFSGEDFEGDEIKIDSLDHTLTIHSSHGATGENLEIFKVLNKHPVLIHEFSQENNMPDGSTGTFTPLDNATDGAISIGSDSSFDGLDDGEIQITEINKTKTYRLPAPDGIRTNPLFQSIPQGKTGSLLLESETRTYAKDKKGDYYTFTLSKAKHGKMVPVKKGKIYLNIKTRVYMSDIY